MALRTPPSWLQNGSHPAENDRLTTKALYNTTGIIGASSLAVTANSPAGMSVLVATGWAAIVGTTQSNMGTYVVFNDATDTLTITTANPTNPRIDRVVATINDAYYTGSTNNVVFQVIAGTPAASPSAPATPANSISLATIAVAAGATQINTGDITDTRVSTTSNLTMGKILQVVEGTTTSSASGSSFGTYFDTNLTASITPSSTSSKILVLVNQNGIYISPGAAAGAIGLLLLRGATTIASIGIGNTIYSAPTQLGQGLSLSKLDSPSSTSSVTYKTQAAPQGAAGTAVGVQYLNQTSTIILMEVAN